ncbi:uncharacterized protein YALI1_F28611g [Yarrowia lipolytica]|uniref:Uncharacterized protein n=1 Tax=Yarrowia lipolytica TaxID=4952 RepID=A0A1D8NPG3_YARLL|nr:hypothetical protein YALI1_F28611g [Yarrowia lipolytica]
MIVRRSIRQTRATTDSLLPNALQYLIKLLCAPSLLIHLPFLALHQNLREENFFSGTCYRYTKVVSLLCLSPLFPKFSGRTNVCEHVQLNTLPLRYCMYCSI